MPPRPETLRTLPQSLDAEKGVLCSALLSPDIVMAACEEVIQPSFFYHPAHQVIFENMLILRGAEKPIDFISLTQILKDKGALERAGGAAVISELFTFVPTASNADYYIEIVREKHILRLLSLATLEVYNSAFSYPGPPSDLLESLEEKIKQIDDVYNAGSDMDEGDTKRHVMEFVLEVERRRRGESTPYLKTPWTALNSKLCGGLLNGEYVLVQGYPNSGKTAWALNLICHVGIVLDLPCVVFEREMKGMRLISRMVAYLTGIDSNKIDRGDLSKHEIDKVSNAVSQIGRSKIHIFDNQKSINSDQCIRRAEAVRRKYDNLALCMVDYLQILSEGEDCETREEEVSKDSKNLKRIADRGATTLVLTQLNDKGQTRESRAPFQDCDLCVEIIQTDNRYERTIKCKKRRDGGGSGWEHKTGFRGETTTFKDL
jgi:replicative DNA helicase